MTNPADLCRECEVRQRVKELEEENRALKEALTWICNRLERAGSARLKGMRRRKRNDRTCKQSLQVGLNQYIKTNSEEMNK